MNDILIASNDTHAVGPAPGSGHRRGMIAGAGGAGDARVAFAHDGFTGLSA
ncbi:MAG: hypothetical protein KGJ94_04450 [Xanthomonadaceae bacterium]|nr:hypothetical protein [Xanthomonadaceae bacterium]